MTYNFAMNTTMDNSNITNTDTAENIKNVITNRQNDLVQRICRKEIKGKDAAQSYAGFYRLYSYKYFQETYI